MSRNKKMTFTDEKGVDDLDKQNYGEFKPHSPDCKLAYQYADREETHQFLKDNPKNMETLNALEKIRFYINEEIKRLERYEL